MKSINLLGSTGSIGVQTLDVARAHGYKIEALTAHSSVDVLESQIREFKPRYAALVDENAAADLKVRVADLPVKVLSGLEGVSFCAAEGEGNITLNSVVGMAGLKPTVDAINAGKTIALANKETLVAGGKLVTDAAKKNGIDILPVDSEHSAIFQCIQGGTKIKKILLTGSGGPFLGQTKEYIKDVTPEMAIKHPRWSMGKKISVDSASLMNKGLELIEAVHLFDVDPSQIEVLVHRESIMHSAVEYIDNSVIAQMSVPDMRLCVQYALTAPHRTAAVIPPLDLVSAGKLTFFEPDTETFPLLAAARRALAAGGAAPAALNAANEVLVDMFLHEKIRFIDIQNRLEEILNGHNPSYHLSLEDIIRIDKETREEVKG